MEELVYNKFNERVRIMGNGFSIKFGKNLDLDADIEETVWITGGHESYPSDNLIDTISSSNAADNQVIELQGHTVDANGDLIFVVQEVTLNGQNKVVLGTPLARVQRLFNADNTDFLGVVYVYEDDTVVAGVPQTQALIHLTVNPEDNQSLKAAQATEKGQYLLVTHLTVSVNKQAATAIVDFAIQIRPKGNVFRTTYTAVVASQNGSRQLFFEQPIIVPPSSDIRIVGTSNANNTGAEAIIHAYYARKV